MSAEYVRCGGRRMVAACGNTMRAGLLVLALLMLVLACANAQSPGMQFRHISSVDGLSSHTIFSACEGKRGFMWFGTYDGLNRYDGESMVIYRHDRDNPYSLYSSHIWSLMAASDSTIWVGTTSGLNKYDFTHDHFHRIPIPDSAILNPTHTIRALKEDGDVLWVGSSNGLMQLDLNTDRFVPFIANNLPTYSLNTGPVYGLALHGSRVYIGTTHGLFVWDGERLDSVSFGMFEEFQRPVFARSLLVDDRDQLWVGTGGTTLGLFRYSITGEQVISHTSLDSGTLQDNRVRVLSQMEDGNIWAGTRDGIAIFSSAGIPIRKLSHDPYDRGSLSQNSIRTIFADSRGLVWIATYSGGINYYNPNSARYIHYKEDLRTDNSLVYNIVSAIYQNEQGDLWIGTENRGISIYDPEAGQFRHMASERNASNTLVNDNIKKILQDRRGRYFIGTNVGLSVYDPAEGTYLNYSSRPSSRQPLPSDIFHDLVEDVRGDVWLGMSGGAGGLGRYDIAKDSITIYRPGASAVQSGITLSGIYSMAYDSLGDRLWIGTVDGLTSFDIGDKRFVGEQHSGLIQYLEGILINDLVLDPGRTLWIGTRGQGLCAFDLESQRFKAYTTEKGLPENSIYALVCDHNGTLWASLTKKLLKIDYDRPFSLSEPNALKIQTFGVQDGMPQMQYYTNAGMLGHDGKVYFGGYDGLVAFHPENVIKEIYHPKVIVTDLLIGNSPLSIHAEEDNVLMNISYMRSIRLDHDQSSFSIRFIGPNYFHQNSTYYQYSIEGFTTGWEDLGTNNSLYFTDFPTGSYTLKLRASSDPTGFADEYTSLGLVIKPPFWATPFAYAVYLLILLALLYLFFVITRKWEGMRQKYDFEHFQREQEEKFHEERIRFFTDVSHELRTPLTLIMAPIEKLIKTARGNARIQHQLMLMQNHGHRMLQLIDQLLNLRKLESGYMSLHAAEGNLVRFVSEVLLSFSSLAESKSLKVDRDIPKGPVMLYYDRDKMEIILHNLLTNAMKYTPEGGEILVRVAKHGADEMDQESRNLLPSSMAKNGYAEVSIENTGKGIPEERLSRIFERFYRSTEQGAVGSGVGLEIVRRMVELHKGTVEAHSTYDPEGKDGRSQFVLRLPLGADHLSNNEIIDHFRSSEDIEGYTSVVRPAPELRDMMSDSEGVPEDKETTLLIVEDNPEVRELISGLFVDLYSVTLAGDGEEGFRLAHEIVPDLIISDIMMPRMDGIELCRQIKSDVKTSHIPVILLTARTAITFKYEGLETGADDYITKPFSPELLRVRVANLIRQRRQMQRQSLQSQGLVSSDISITSVDEQLLQKAIDYIRDNMADPHLTVEKISEELGLSRVHFYRKIKGLTNLTATEFIRKVRLDQAALLLKTNKLRVSEVRYMIGMQDADYFRNCFKEQFGVSPREFIEKAESTE